MRAGPGGSGMTTLARPILRWHGGKWRIAPWIIGHIPAHDVYVEPFGGAASVLLRKTRSRLEVYNDLDGDVVNLFRVLRVAPDDLARSIAMTPFSRAEFDSAYVPDLDPIERARRMLIRSHMGFGSNAVHRKSGFRAAGVRAGSLPVHNWCAMPEVIRDVSERFRGVVIEQRPAVDVLLAHDGPNTVHYVDPPYLMATRGDTRADYAHEMTEADHIALLACIRGLTGCVILSGYPHHLYDYTLSDWRRITRDVTADGAHRRTEMRWLNRACTRAIDMHRAPLLDVDAS